MRRGLLAILSLHLIALPILAHKGKKHALTPDASPQSTEAESKRLGRINGLYLQNVKPIFRKKCFDCHAAAERLPWYFKVPGPRQLMLRDMREAKKHLDMRQDFPFLGHGTPLEDLNAIAGTIKNGSMPPWRYRIIHRGSALTPKEKKAIRAWIEEGRRELGRQIESERRN